MDLAGAVGGDDNDRRRVGRRTHGAELRDGDLEIGKHFQQECLKRFVGAIEFVDEQYRWPPGLRQFKRLQDGSLDEEITAVNGLLQRETVVSRFSKADSHHLLGGVPFVCRRVQVKPFVTLQADQRAIQHRREHLGDFGLADAGFAFKQQRTAHAQCQENNGGQGAVGNVMRALQTGADCID